MRVKKLTIKQESFCQEYIKNSGNASEAYRHAYNTSKMKSKTVNERSSRLTREYIISTRLDQLKKDIADLNLWTIERSVKVLSKIAENSGDETAITAEGEEVRITSKHVDRIAAVKELNSMHGFKSDTTIDLKSSDSSMTPVTEIKRTIIYNDSKP